MNGMKRIAGAALAVVLLVALAGCGDRPGEAIDIPDGALVIKGAGASFPQPLYARWIGEYSNDHSGVVFTYEGVGSGEGIKRFLAGEVDFGASDAAMSDAELAKVDPERRAVMVPMTVGMVVLAYNLPGVDSGLTLPRDVYLDIFAGKIAKWNDPRIVAANPGIGLPGKDIVTVVRRDSSGATFAMTNHMAAASPWWSGEQGPGIGKLVDWPGNAMTAVGNEGVAQRVKITEGGIGYMEYELAERLGLPIAKLQNKAGEAVAPSPTSGQAALASVRDIPADLRVFLPDPDGTGAYPLVTYTWLLLHERYKDSAKARALQDALASGLAEGHVIAEQMGYVPLPQTMVAKAGEALSRIR